jgi:hypothetical protein
MNTGLAILPELWIQLNDIAFATHGKKSRNAIVEEAIERYVMEHWKPEMRKAREACEVQNRMRRSSDVTPPSGMSKALPFGEILRRIAYRKSQRNVDVAKVLKVTDRTVNTLFHATHPNELSPFIRTQVEKWLGVTAQELQDNWQNLLHTLEQT